MKKKSRGTKSNGLLLAWLTSLSAMLVLGASSLAMGTTLSVAAIRLFAVFTAFAFVAIVTLHFKPDESGILPIAVFLTGIGVAVQFRMSFFAKREALDAIPLAIGMGAMIVAYLAASGGRWKALQSIGWVCYAAAVGLLVAMLVFGRSYRGGIYLPGNVNPSEAVKPLLVLFLASYLSGHRRDFSETTVGIPMPSAGALWTLVLLWLVPMAIVVLLHDLGLLLLLNATLVVMLYTTGRRVGYLAIGAVGVALSGAAVYFTSAHARARFDVWLDPFKDPTGAGWQSLQGFSAMNAGGVWGAGIGAGTPQFVPIVTSDFVYSAMGEELGIILCALVLVLFAVLVARGFAVAAGAKTPYGTLAAAGLTSALGFQVLLNVGGVVGALPMTGIVLPYLSQGGSGLAVMLAMAGLLAAFK